MNLNPPILNEYLHKFYWAIEKKSFQILARKSQFVIGQKLYRKYSKQIYQMCPMIYNFLL